MPRLTCSDLERLGLWAVEGCCRRCHSDVRCPDEFVFETLNAAGEALRIELCCSASSEIDWTSITFARVFSASTPAEVAYRQT